MRYKVGDKVKVRKDLVVGNFYKMNDTNDMSIYVSYMDSFKENIMIIKKVLSTHYIMNENNWNWTDEMLEKVN